MGFITLSFAVTGPRKPLLKGKTKYNSPPCDKYIRLPALDFASITHFFTKQATWMMWQGTLTDGED